MEQSEAPKGYPKPRHISRSTQGQPKEEETQTYVVKEGQVWGTNPELQAGDTVELTEKEAAGFEDKLEEVGIDGEAKGRLPAGAVSSTTETVQPPQVDDSQSGRSVPRGSKPS